MPVNVTLLFSAEHYVAAVEAYMRCIDRRLTSGRDPCVGSVASLFVSRWDVAIKDKVPAALRNRLGTAIASSVYQSHREVLDSPRWRRLTAQGAHPQRLLWASTGSKDPAVSDVFYVEALAAPDTINTMPEKTLLAYADHGKPESPMPLEGRDADTLLAEFSRAGIDPGSLATALQREGTEGFTTSWRDLMGRIASKISHLTMAKTA